MQFDSDEMWLGWYLEIMKITDQQKSGADLWKCIDLSAELPGHINSFSPAPVDSTGASTAALEWLAAPVPVESKGTESHFARNQLDAPKVYILMSKGALLY